MRMAVCGIGALLVVAIGWGRICGTDQAAVGYPSGSAVPDADASAGDLIALNGGTSQGHRELVIIDRRRRVMAVYHIDSQSGQVALRCVRNLQWDFSIDDFNGVKPSPREIQALMETR